MGDLSDDEFIKWGHGQPAGQTVDPAAGPYPVFPGLVDVTAAGTSTVQPVDQKVDLTGQDATPVALTASLRPEAEKATVAAVQKSLADCMAQKTLAPVGCPFSTTSFGDPPLNVRWSLTGTPQIEVASVTYDFANSAGTN